jgi:protein phosphatase
MRVALRTDVGRSRAINEDCAFADPDLGLAILADGMGGHAAGEIASNLAVKTLAGSVAVAVNSGIGEGRSESIESILSRSIEDANQTIRARALEDVNFKGMGTTVVVALSQGSSVHIAHVGDSRAYVMHEGRLRQITRDHSLVAEMVAAGEISEKEARSHRLRYVLTRTLGNEPVVQADVQEVRWQDEDCLMLCSDGLTNMIEDRRIEKILRRCGKNLERACEELVEAANSRGGGDNITVILACPV